MLNSKLFTTIFAITATVCFAACDDKDDNVSEVNTCDPSACEIVENATEMACDDAGQCVVKSCIESFKVSEDVKSCVVDEQTCECDHACKDTESCVKGEGDKCECREQETPATCDPACEDGKTKCECADGKCSCVPVNVTANECDGKSVGDECAEGKTCQDDNGVLVCKDKLAPEHTCEPACNADTEECLCEAGKCECKPLTVEECKCADGTVCPDGDKTKCVTASVEDKCAGKLEGDECDANKTCQKVEDGKLECEDIKSTEEPTDQAQPE